MNMTPALICLFTLTLATIGLAIYRKILAKGEDTNIHLTSGGGAVIESQNALAGKLSAVDKWGKTLTIITFVVGLAIGSAYVYEALLAVPF